MTYRAVDSGRRDVAQLGFLGLLAACHGGGPASLRGMQQNTRELTSQVHDVVELTRVICDVLACQVRSGHLANRKKR